MDRDIFENGPRADADLFSTDKKRRVFKKIRIRVDGALEGLFKVLSSHLQMEKQSKNTPIQIYVPP